MKVRLNKQTLAKIPEPIRSLVIDWKANYHKSSISVVNRAKVFAEEDATYIAFSTDLRRSQTERAAGEWAGMTRLSPTAEIPLPPGCTLVAKGFFCGHPWLTIYHNAAPPLLPFADALPTPAPAFALPAPA